MNVPGAELSSRLVVLQALTKLPQLREPRAAYCRVICCFSSFAGDPCHQFIQEFSPRAQSVALTRSRAAYKSKLRTQTDPREPPVQFMRSRVSARTSTYHQGIHNTTPWPKKVWLSQDRARQKLRDARPKRTRGDQLSSISAPWGARDEYYECRLHS